MPANDSIRSLARRRWAAIVIVFILTFGANGLWAKVHGMPVPYIQDEFSYLLAGDTFAHGRITNPTHPMWRFFETFHVLQKPTYMSKFPPGQGVFLALGQVIFGRPIYGVWLAAALMSAAMAWMLYAWLPPRWALIGGIIAAMQFGIFTYWSQSYWGGAVAAFGGALVFGALPRIFQFQRLRDALWLGLGLAILVNTRPLEGIVWGLPLGCLLLPWKIAWSKVDQGRFTKNAVLPLAGLIIMIAAITGAYNQKITGHAWLMPHELYSQQYSTMPVFLWQPLYKPVQYDQKILADFFQGWNIRYYQYKKTWRGFWDDLFRDSLYVTEFYFGFPLACVCLPVLTGLFFRPETRRRYWIGLVFILAILGCLTYKGNDYYYAPWTCMAVLLMTVGLRLVYHLRLARNRVGPLVVIFLMGFQLFCDVALTPAKPLGFSWAQPAMKTPGLPPYFTREQLKNILLKRGGRYLVIVHYYPEHNLHREWIFNDADIDHAPIVWARDMGKDKDKILTDYFNDRKVILIHVYWDIQGSSHFTARQ